MIMMTGPDYTSPTDLVTSMPSSPALPSESGYIDTRHISAAGPPLCAGCSQPILDQFILQVQGRMWHSDCLRCFLCRAPLSNMCYSGHTDLYCQEDFFRLFGAQCSSCNGTIPETDMVRRAQDNIYHMDCFRCRVCSRELYTGDEFYLCDDGQLLCKVDYLAVKAKEQGQDENTNPANETSSYREEKEKLFKHYYTQTSRPRRDVIEKIALEAGTEPSEVRSWFRQQRAKNHWKGNSHDKADENQSDMANRVLAPLGGYPLPIVNKAFPSERLPKGANQQFMPSQTLIQATGGKSHWTSWAELWSDDFVAPNVNLEPENLENGEVIGFCYQHPVTKSQHEPENLENGEVIGFCYQHPVTKSQHELQNILYM